MYPVKGPKNIINFMTCHKLTITTNNKSSCRGRCVFSTLIYVQAYPLIEVNDATDNRENQYKKEEEEEEEEEKGLIFSSIALGG